MELKKKGVLAIIQARFSSTRLPGKVLKKINNKPKFLILDTIKGKGVSFMEHTKVMQKQKIYNWHAGAPDNKNFLLAQKEIIQKIKTRFRKYKISYPLFLNINDNKEMNFNAFSAQVQHT
jgi:hypothetical protein